MHRFTPIMFAVLTAVVPSVASADTYLNLRISASACRPNAASKAKIKLQSGAWVYNSGQSGAATLFCPLHLAQPNPNADSSNIDSMRLWYRDPDGTSPASRVTATLMEREWDDSSGTAVTSGFISSNNYVATVQRRESIWVFHSTVYQDYSYYVEVEMYRAQSTTTTPTFVGLDFHYQPIT